MDNAEGSVVKGHSRTRSAAKAARPLSVARGPLDVDDIPPLGSQAQAQAQTPPHSHPPRTPRPTTPLGRESPVPYSPGGRSPRPAPPPIDLSHLLRPDVYHALPTQHIPAPFRTSPAQPPIATPLPTLLAQGHYRLAAAAAARALTSGAVAPSDAPAVYDLLYTRLACLTLLGPAGTAMAAQEARALGDADLGRGQKKAGADDQGVAAAAAAAVPWALRLLHVRLQALGFGDPRRAVMSYFEMARECRARIAAAAAAAAARRAKEGAGAEEAEEAETVWRERLADLGLRVAGVLIEMEDLEGAACHLASLREGDGGDGGGRLALARALLWLHLGDVEAARGCVQPGQRGDRVVAALCDMADGEYGAALEKWRHVQAAAAAGGDSEMAGVNLAVCLLYVGKMQEGKAQLEKLVDEGYASHTLLFNLSTMYELCSDQAKTLKLRLAERVAGMAPTPSGWEKTNADFKL
ncbi:hypothetical protein P8C59_006723 [Phyllachora maydis]|uniref:Tetratricopeptide repeat protein 15 n=1 Tax=Phyllachora maydis TaxID=1825666 RepID=A0AAD9I884_9PEZI|nr:hypothetical protein P8C59_006723 [Phyllachora maydis]